MTTTITNHFQNHYKNHSRALHTNTKQLQTYREICKTITQSLTKTITTHANPMTKHYTHLQKQSQNNNQTLQNNTKQLQKHYKTF